MKLGRHVSIAGGIDKAPNRAKKLGCNCLQLFAKNPRGWRGRKLTEQEANRVKKEMHDLKMEILVVHATYLINLASPNYEVHQKSVKGLKEDFQRAGMIGAKYLVVHPGSHGGTGIKNGIKRISQAINLVLSEVENDTMILLENISGAGSGIGSNFQEIHDIINNIDNKKKIGICLDTCHAYAAGYNLSNKVGIEKMFKELSNILSCDFLKLVHINDSKYPLGSKKDEHAHLGEGFIGIDGIKELVNHPNLKDLPFILETPPYKDEDKDIEMIFSLRKELGGKCGNC